MASGDVAAFWRDLERALTVGKREAMRQGVAVLYQGTLDELARGSPGRGRRYKRGRRRFHTASRPGSAPARDTGNLIRSIGTEVAQDGSQGAVGVKRSAPYARYLDPTEGEEPRIGRRPFLTSAFRKHREEAERTIRREIERQLRSVIR